MLHLLTFLYVRGMLLEYKLYSAIKRILKRFWKGIKKRYAKVLGKVKKIPGSFKRALKWIRRRIARAIKWAAEKIRKVGVYLDPYRRRR